MERYDLADDRPDLVERLTALHDRWLSTTPLAGRDRKSAGYESAGPTHPDFE